MKAFFWGAVNWLSFAWPLITLESGFVLILLIDWKSIFSKEKNKTVFKPQPLLVISGAVFWLFCNWGTYLILGPDLIGSSPPDWTYEVTFTLFLLSVFVFLGARYEVWHTEKPKEYNKKSIRGVFYTLVEAIWGITMFVLALLLGIQFF